MNPVGLLVWLVCLPLVSACNPWDLSDTDCTFSRRTMIGLIAACVVAACSFFLCGIYLRRRRARERALQANGAGRLTQLRKPYGPTPGGYPTYYQPGPPLPPPVQIPQFPPRGYDTCHRQSRLQRHSTSTIRTMPESLPPAPPTLRHSPSSTVSGTTPAHNAPMPSTRSSVHRQESTATLPPLPSPSESSATSPHRTGILSTLPELSGLSSTSAPHSPSAVAPPAASPQRAPQPSAALPLSPPRPPALAPMYTGASTNVIEEPPPAYTPI